MSSSISLWNAGQAGRLTEAGKSEYKVHMGFLIFTALFWVVVTASVASANAYGALGRHATILVAMAGVSSAMPLLIIFHIFYTPLDREDQQKFILPEGSPIERQRSCLEALTSLRCSRPQIQKEPAEL